MRFRKRWPVLLTLTVAALLGGRLVWRLSGSETGWAAQIDQWADVGWGLVGVERVELEDQPPAEQAEYWLAEVERVAPAADDPQVALGAVWMLDAPQFGFLQRHIVLRESFPGLPATLRTELDYDAVAVLTAEFESRCRDECLARITHAVRLDAADVELRRAQALLLFRVKSLSLDSEPRRDDWLSVLDECARTDPENALYDYLAALHLWTAAAHYDLGDEGYLLEIDDEEMFEQGRARFAAGLGKPHLRFGTEGYPATLRFLEETSVPRNDHVKAAGSRQIDGRATNLLYRIVRWQRVRCDVEQRAGRLDAAVAAVRDVRTISDQISETGNNPNLLTPKLVLRSSSLALLKELSRDHPHLMNEQELAQLSAEHAEVQLDVRVLGEVGRRMAAKAGAPPEGELSGGMSTAARRQLMSGLLMATSQMLLIVTISLTLVSSLIGWLFRRADDDGDDSLGWVRHAVAWLVGLGGSYLWLGLFPAEVVSADVQSWLVCGALWLAFAALFLGVLILFARRFDLPARQVAALVATPALLLFAFANADRLQEWALAGFGALHAIISIAVVLVFLVFCWGVVRSLRSFVNDSSAPGRRKALVVMFAVLLSLAAVTVSGGLVVTARGGDGQPWIPPTAWPEARGLNIGAAELRSLMHLEEFAWTWAFLQWLGRRGAVAGPCVAMAVLFVWSWIRRARLSERGLRTTLRFDKRRETGQSAMTVARSCVVMSLVAVIVYCSTAPAVADISDTYHRVYYERLADPAQTWREVDQVTRDVRSDRTTMVRLQAEIDEHNRRIAEQNASAGE